jgi:hypothetical protein
LCLLERVLKKDEDEEGGFFFLGGVWVCDVVRVI